MLVLLLTGLFALEPLGIPVSAIAAVCAALLFAVAARGRIISTRAQGCTPEAVSGQLVEGQRQPGCEPGIVHAVDHQLHAQRKRHHLPGRLAQHPPG